MLPSVDEARRLKEILPQTKIRLFKDSGHTLLLVSLYWQEVSTGREWRMFSCPFFLQKVLGMYMLRPKTVLVLDPLHNM